MPLVEKLEKMQAIKSGLESLIDVIDVLRLIRVDFNCNPDEAWDLILTTELDSLEDVKTYAIHPAHVAVAKELIGPYKADREDEETVVEYLKPEAAAACARAAFELRKRYRKREDGEEQEVVAADRRLRRVLEEVRLHAELHKVHKAGEDRHDVVEK